MADLPPATIPVLSLDPHISQEDVNATAIVTTWLCELEILLAQQKVRSLSDLFIEDSWWRDMVTLTWDITSKHGLDAIGKYIANSSVNLTNLHPIESGGLQPALVNVGGLFWIQSGFTFKSSHGYGRGFVRLANISARHWKAWLLFTQLEELHEKIALQVETDRHSENCHPDIPNSGMDPRDIASTESEVLIVGAGQTGLALGAHLRKMGMQPIILEKESQVGSAWLSRYKTFKLHTPTYTDHYPFMKYPEDWPRWLPREKVVLFMEQYAKAMGLDIRLETKVTRVKYDELTCKYRVDVESVTEPQTFYARQVVLAAGSFTTEPIMPIFLGQDLFKGQIYHSKDHDSASLTSDLQNKRVIIVGAGTSSHDIAQDFVNHGAKSVAMVQRNPIFSFSSASFEKFILPLWKTDGVTTDEADIMSSSIPTAVARTMGFGITRMMCEYDKELIDGLRAAGLVVNNGEEGSNFLDYQLIKGGRFYIDQGASQMIIDGRIKIHQCDEGVQQFDAAGLILADGTHLDADIIIMATGFKLADWNIKQIMGDEIHQRCGGENFFQLNHEQERAWAWRPTGIPGFWCNVGNFIWSRQFSLPLALQIAAVKGGLNENHYHTQKTI